MPKGFAYVVPPSPRDLEQCRTSHIIYNSGAFLGGNLTQSPIAARMSNFNRVSARLMSGLDLPFLPGRDYGHGHTMVDSQKIGSTWLSKFASSLESGDPKGAGLCFLQDGYLRDVLAFGWDSRSLKGPQKISSYLEPVLKSVRATGFQLDDTPGLSPEYGPISPATVAVCSGFKFTTNLSHCKGYFRLIPDNSGEWNALSMFVTAEDLKNYEERSREKGVYGDHTISWVDVKRERREAIEQNPYVLIVGAGQTGLNIAARFKQMDIPTLVVDKNKRVGDNWRTRYPTLTLHTINTHHTMLYQPYPKNWPLYTPRDKLADWLEQYVESQDLVVWTDSPLLPGPKYDEDRKEWTVIIRKSGNQIQLNPKHIVIATGTLGLPLMPDIPGRDLFQGIVLHGSEFQGAKDFKGKQVVVIGAGNTSADICQDAVFNGAKSCTMIQRSSTCVISIESISEALAHGWPDNVPTDVSDFKFASIPFHLFQKLLSENADQRWEIERQMHKGLREAGLDVNLGPGDAGNFPLVFLRAGGYWLDVGCAKLISSGQVKIKHGVEVAKLTEDSVMFTDGSSLEANVVIFATGYQNIRDSMKDLLGEEVVSRTKPVWGVDEEGELNGCYRPTGHPGLWYGAGDFFNSRFSSKQLAMTIKASQLGLAKL